MTKYIVKPTSRFKKELKKGVKRGLDTDKLNSIVKLLADGMPLPQ